MTSATPASAETRLTQFARVWSVRIEKTMQTDSSLIAFGVARGENVVLKIVKTRGDEWRAGDVLAAFHGSGAVRVLELAEGAALLERAMPGETLVELSKAGRDDEAIGILGDIIGRMSAGATEVDAPSARDWAGAFSHYASSGDVRIPRDMVSDAADMFARLVASQTKTRVLHGDLQHYNVLRDESRGWLAIDPKGVIAETEYEIGAVFRNPAELPSLFLDRATIERRAHRFATGLRLDLGRILAWGFAQAVLSAIWHIEDGYDVGPEHLGLELARLIRPMLDV